MLGLKDFWVNKNLNLENVLEYDLICSYSTCHDFTIPDLTCPDSSRRDLTRPDLTQTQLDQSYISSCMFTILQSVSFRRTIGKNVVAALNARQSYTYKTKAKLYSEFFSRIFILAKISSSMAMVSTIFSSDFQKSCSSISWKTIQLMDFLLLTSDYYDWDRIWDHLLPAINNTNFITYISSKKFAFQCPGQGRKNHGIRGTQEGLKFVGKSGKNIYQDVKRKENSYLQYQIIEGYYMFDTHISFKQLVARAVGVRAVDWQ